MRRRPHQALPWHTLLLLALGWILAACSTSRPLPPYEKPLPKVRFQTVRTTAYTHTESDHRPYGNKSALGTPLRSGPLLHSAAADWARWPAGTLFKICSTGETFQVDDYGWALAGRNTLDLYKPSRAQMNAWGVRRERIEILRWGDPWASYRRLRPVSKYRHIARMMSEIRSFYSSASPAPAPNRLATPEIPTTVAQAVLVSKGEAFAPR
jgi:3D (Asp-Asp-Asp) domain-containing protein